MPAKLSNPEDIIGLTFGFLTVRHLLQVDEYRYGKNTIRTRKRYLYECSCCCGGTKNATRTSLLTGHTKTCGCDSRPQKNRSPRWKGYGEISGHYWGKLQRGAQYRNIAFCISIEEAWDIALKQNRRCAITGLLLQFGKNQTASVDRIDSRQGYLVDNIHWIHKDINKMKMDLPLSRFVVLCRSVADHRRHLDQVRSPATILVDQGVDLVYKVVGHD